MDFLKEIFTNATDGKLSFDELKAACEKGGIKLADLATGNYISKQKYTDEISSRDTRIGTLETTLKERDEDIKNISSQLEGAGADKDKLAQLNTQLTDLQSKYDADTKKLEQDMLNQRRTYAVKEFAGSKKFSSNAAKRDFEQYMMKKEFSLSDSGSIIGGDDFVAEYSKDNADAFVVETKKSEETADTKPLPEFVGSTPGNNGESKAFQFKFTGVRPSHKE